MAIRQSPMPHYQRPGDVSASERDQERPPGKWTLPVLRSQHLPDITLEEKRRTMIVESIQTYSVIR